MRIKIPLKTVSIANVRTHWGKSASRAKTEREVVAWSCLVAGVTHSKNARVKLTRIAPRRMDSDNLIISFKSVRDGVATALGLSSDRDRKGLVWEYAQEYGAKGEYAIVIDLEV